MQLWFRHFVGGKPSPTRNDPDYCPSLELGYGGKRPKTMADKERFQRHMKRMHVGKDVNSSVKKDTIAKAEKHDEHVDNMSLESTDVDEQSNASQVQVKSESNKNIGAVKCPAPGCTKTYKGRAWLSHHWGKVHQKEWGGALPGRG